MKLERKGSVDRRKSWPDSLFRAGGTVHESTIETWGSLVSEHSQ